MDKYYRVKKDTFLWVQGAILRFDSKLGNSGGYAPLEDIWSTVPTVKDEYICSHIIEHADNSEWFERIYPDSVSGKIYRTKDQLIEVYKSAFN